MVLKKIYLFLFVFLVCPFFVFSWNGGPPITADPKVILDYPQKNWRDSRYEVFRWDSFPSIIIFDTENYKVQNDLFKRLAFFVEKAGFRGRLATNREIDLLHGWNAHDYRAEDLARFFEEARRTQFALNWEEGELAEILLATGVIHRNMKGEFVAGTGAVLSISRESPEYLRYRFMVHEGFHGIFFIDEDFRNFSKQRFDNFSPQAKRFIIAFFNFQGYDTNDPYLVVNEFMAHILQQSVSHAGEYFGKTLPSRIATSRHYASLPAKDNDTDSYPYLARAFQAEAQTFSNYVNQRWGLAAGRVWK